MDTAAWVQAGSAVVLMIITGWYAKLTREISRAAQESAKLSERAATAAEASAETGASAVAISERTMLLANMPQLVSWSTSSSREGLLILVENYGPTPAYNVEVTLFFGETRQRRSDPWKLAYPLVPKERVDEIVAFAGSFEEWEAHKVFESQIRYNDAVGNRFMARLWHYREWDEKTPQSTIYLVNSDGSLENLTTNVALTP